MGRGSKTFWGPFILFFEGVQIKIGVQFYLFLGSKKNGGPKKYGPIFSFWVQKNGVQFFIFWVEGGSKKSGPIFGGGPFFLFCGPEKMGVQ